MAFHLLALLILTGAAQRTLLSGHVVDQTGGLLPGVLVTATNSSGISVEVVTDDAGQFSLAVAPGSYKLRLELYGFQTVTIDSVEVAASTPEPLEVVLQSGIPVDDRFLVAAGQLENPAVEIDFAPAGEPQVGRTFAGDFIIRNVGRGDVLIPGEPWGFNEAYIDGQVTMEVFTWTERGPVSGSGWLRCVPGDNCTQLGPGRATRLRLEGGGSYPEPGALSVRLVLRFAGRVEGANAVSKPITKTVVLEVAPR